MVLLLVPFCAAQAPEATAQGLLDESIPLTCTATEPSPRALSLNPPADLAKAEQELYRLLEKDPNNVTAHFDLATLSELKNDFTGALLQYRSALQLDPSCADCVVAFSTLLDHCQHTEASIKLAENFLRAVPDSAGVLRHLSFLYLGKGKNEEAIALGKRLQKVEKESGVGFQVEALGHLAMNQLDEAESYFELARDHDDTVPEPFLYLGRLYSKRPETFDQAALNFRKAIDLGLEHPEVHKELGNVLLLQGKLRDAVKQLHQALELDWDYPEPYRLLSVAYEKLKEPERAAAASKRFDVLNESNGARRAEREQAFSSYVQGIEFLQEKNPREAYSAFQRATEVFPEMDVAYFRLAQIQAMSGRLQEARNLVRKAIEHNSLRPEYQLLLAETLQESDVEAALEAVKEAALLNPENAEPYNMYGNLLFGKGDYKAAIASYRKAIEKDSDNAIFHLNLSSALGKSGDEAGSKREKELYLQLLKSQ